MFDFYTRFYQAVASSAANADYCARVYGRNLCQHGFADLDHLDHLIQVSEISAGTPCARPGLRQRHDLGVHRRSDRRTRYGD